MARRGGVNFHQLPQKFRRPVGCQKCHGTGYRGRTVIAETLMVGPEIAQALSRDASAEEIYGVAVEQGMTSMLADGIRRAAEGQTTLEEIYRVAGLSPAGGGHHFPIYA